MVLVHQASPADLLLFEFDFALSAVVFAHFAAAHIAQTVADTADYFAHIVAVHFAQTVADTAAVVGLIRIAAVGIAVAA